MKKRMIIAVVLLFSGFLIAEAVNAEGVWTKIKDSDGIKSYERSVPGTDLKEFIAVTTIDAKMEVIGEVLRDVPQFSKWIADCESARIEKKYDRNTFVMYLLLDPPLISKRDIILKNETIYDYENGKARIDFFCTDDVKIPVEKKRTRVTIMNGLYQMEYLGRNKTKFIYKLKVDPAGDIPKRVAYAVMKAYPFNTLKALKKMVREGKYAEAARGSVEEREINTRAMDETHVRKIFSNNMMSVVKDKNALGEIINADTEGIQSIAASGSDYEVIQKMATNTYFKYIDRIVADKKAAEDLKHNKKLIAEITDMVTTYCEASRETVDNLIARYNQ